MESRSTTIRNAGFVIAGAIALVFAVWRGVVAQRQAESALRQAETAEQALLNERYQQGAGMLFSRVLRERMEGIRSLEQLAKDQPDSYYVRVTQLISDFARDPSGIEEN